MPFGNRQSKIIAILGPTNTGKTHYAIDRMLGYQSGMIGFPLRLLARENYERVVSVKGRSSVALVTGEEKILPTNPSYYICTVESMPLDRCVEFLAIDEIQMSGDPERGHIFTDRLLRARGSEETIFLGADTIRPIIAKLIPEINFITRPRLSKLSYIGPKKITRLPRKTAVVAFSINEVYAIAELMRRQRGGTAVVLGALSPRTRNAQVEMYQKGEVDYLVATDAIGMGLNMNIDHVAFSGLRKFDGKKYRQLFNTEIAQIAGRAGRKLSDGTFGSIAGLTGFDEQIIDSVEQHEFDPLRGIYWRNENLDFRTGKHLQKSLNRRSNNNILLKGHIADDKLALDQLLSIKKISNYAANQDAVKLLWEVCQIPDFRKMMTDVHTNLLARIFEELINFESLSTDWVASQVSQLERVDGNIDSLMARIAHIRTWTYISHRGDWLNDSETWQVRTRLLEDKLSDALHNALTQRFVDRRAATLSRIRGDKQVSANVGKDGDVFVDGEFVGHLNGFRFIPDRASGLEYRRNLVAAANKVLHIEIEARVSAICKADNNSLSIDMLGQINWGTAKVARLDRGHHITSPSVLLLVNEYLTDKQNTRIRTRISAWVRSQMEFALGDLLSLKEAKLSGLARGLAYQMVESLGSLRRWAVIDELGELSKKERASLRLAGIRFGPESLFIPSLIKPRAVMWRSLLWRVYTGRKVDLPPGPGLVTISVSNDLPDEYVEACGYTQIGGRIVRVDVLNRLATDLQKQSRAGGLKIGNSHLNLLGLSMINARPIFEALGYTLLEKEGNDLWKYSGRQKNIIRDRRLGLKETNRNRTNSKRLRKDLNSPFSKLREFKLN